MGAHSRAVNGVSFHQSGYYLMSCSQDRSMRIWDIREGRLLFTMLAHKDSVNSCMFSSDGDHFLSGSSDGLVMAWRSGLDVDQNKDEGIETENRSKRSNIAPSKSTNLPKEPPKHTRTSLIGANARRAARASAATRRGTSQGSTTSSATSTAQQQDDKDEKLQAFARAVQVLDKRLRMN